MASTINATTSGVVTTGDTVASLSLQTGGTNALTINSTQAIGVGSGSSFGTTGQFLTSQGSAASPTWTSGGTGTVTSVSWTGGIVSVATATTTPAFTIAGTSGGIPYFNSGTTWASSSALTQYGIVYGGGAGGSPVSTAAGTTGQFLGANTSGAPTWQTPAGASAATPTALGTVYASTNLSSTNPYYNTCIGYNAGLNLGSGGAANTILGESAGLNKTSGNQCIYMGYSSGSSASVNTEMVINASGNTPVGKGSATGYIVAGNTPGGIYQGNNSASWSTTSDQRLKKNIADNHVGLDAINAVRVRNFEYRLPEEVDAELDASCAINKEGIQLGVIAQELQTVLPDCVKQESTGVLSVDSDNLTWYTINAIKQLSAALDAANDRIAALEAK
jgi:hypothetical protein